jgi:predicted nuclease of predicted toxin-antitoxin system
MLCFVDANLPRSVAALLVKLGHQVEFARDVGLGAAPDQDIAVHVKRTGAALITRDLDFADVRRYPPEEFGGIIVLRVPDSAVAHEIVQVLERFMRESTLVGQVKGRLAIVEYDRVRFRPPT